MRLGEYDWRDNRERLPHVDYTVERAYAHEDYRPPNSEFEDIGILRLTRKVSFEVHIKPIGLVRVDGLFLNAIARMTGWGSTGKDGPRNSKLQEIYQTIQSYNNIHLTTKIEKNYGPCVGDSGGPLTVLHNNKRLLLGVFIRHVCSPSGHWGPAIYMRVSLKIEWIRAAMNRLSRGH